MKKTTTTEVSYEATMEEVAKAMGIKEKVRGIHSEGYGGKVIFFTEGQVK